MSISAELCATLNASATDWFAKCLAESDKAQRLFSARGLSGPVMRRYRLGFAPESGTGLYRQLSSAGYSDRVLIEAGLALQSEAGRVIDRFRGKLMFPILDRDGVRVLGFQSRQLDDSQPKYINSPATVLFDKSRLLYGLPQLTAIEAAGEALVAEGNFDLLAMLSHGIDNVVAAMGTALTGEHLYLLAEHAPRITLIFDADRAGREAARKTLLLPGAADFDIGVVSLDGGKDPDELLREDAGRWPGLMARRLDRWQALWTAVRGRYGEQLTLDDRLAFQYEWFPLVSAHAPPELLREQLARGATELGIDPAIVWGEYLPQAAGEQQQVSPDELLLVAVAQNWERLRELAGYIDLEGSAGDELERWRRMGEAELSARLRHIERQYGDKAPSVWLSFWAARIRPRLQQRYRELGRNTANAPPGERARLDAELVMVTDWLSRPTGL